MGNQQLTLGSLFDGSGAFPLGGVLSGIAPVWNSEIEPFPVLVTHRRMPGVKHYGDVSKLSGADLPPVDIITFGSPCQDLSIAGKRAGIHDGDRSSLFFQAIRIIKEMRDATNGQYPRFCVWENVPGAFSSNGGNDFKAVLEAVMIRNKGDQFAVRNALSVGEDTEGGFTVPDEFERRLIQALEENNIFRQMATVIKTNSGTRKIPIANDTMEAQWIDEGEEIPETDTRFGQTTLSAYKLGTMIKISNELLHDSAFDLASYIAARFGVAMGNAEERAFFTGDGDKKPLGILDETGGAQLGVTSASQTQITFDEIFDLYYSLKSPYRRNAQFVCNETILLQLMKLKDKNDQYLWKPSLDIAKPDTLLGRPIRTTSFMPGIGKGERVLLFGDMKHYWVADRQARTFRRLNELYARTDQVGFMTTQRVDGRLILPEAVKVLKMAGNKTGGSTGGNAGGAGGNG